MLTPLTSILLPGLRFCRRKARLTQVELARRVGLRPETLSRIEKQCQAAGLTSAQRLADELGVSLQELTIGGEFVEQTSVKGKAARLPPTERVCRDCHLLKPIEAYTPIKATKTGHYGRCRVCRNKRARERYHADPEERQRQIARARRNQLRRLSWKDQLEAFTAAGGWITA